MKTLLTALVLVVGTAAAVGSASARTAARSTRITSTIRTLPSRSSAWEAESRRHTGWASNGMGSLRANLDRPWLPFFAE
jgi:hypothetical protein